MKISSTCVPTLKFLSSSITTNCGCTRLWATVLRKSLNDKPSAKVRLQMQRLRRSRLSSDGLNLLRGCWSRDSNGFHHHFRHFSDVVLRHVFVEEVAHRIDEYPPRTAPVERLTQFLGNQP